MPIRRAPQLPFKGRGLRLVRACLAFALSVTSLHALSQISERWLEGTKSIDAVTRDGHTITIGKVHFQPAENGITHFTITMDGAKFTDHFLSMKEFKCLDGEEISCHVAYPYPNPQTITVKDYAWLEHSLLFLFKQPRDFGAKLWNGSYYQLQPDGQGLKGRAQAIDLNHISAPSATPGIPPYSPDLRTDAAPGSRWLDHLLIR